MLSDSKTRELAELKKDLEERIIRAEHELGLLRLSLGLVDEALTKISFKPASKLISPQAEAPPVQSAPAPSAAYRDAPAAAPISSTAASSRIPEKAYAAPPIEKPAPPRPQQSPPPQTVSPEDSEQGFPIKSKNGEDIGTLYIGQYSVRIIPSAALKLNVKTPPFQSFFVDRVIGEMRRKDEMAVDAGSKDPMSIIDHKIALDGEFIKEILITNIDDDARVRELRSSIRWTFERMMEKRTG